MTTDLDRPRDAGDPTYPDAERCAQTMERCEEDLLTEAQFVRWQGQEIDRLTRERDEARAEVKSLRAENHNLNWALGTEGYEQMATPEEQAEHEEAVRRTDEVLDRMAAAKAEHDAKYRDAERYRWLRQMIYDDRIIVAADRMLHGEALDSAIDAALAQIEQERSEQAEERA